MPIRHETHETGDKAVAEVVYMFRQLGFACEEISRDYGEDLLVQPAHNRQVDSFKLWVQVKGTRDIDRYRSEKHGVSMDFPMGHARKWALAFDPVIVVLWDVSKQYGLYCFPQDQMNLQDLHVFINGKARMIFEDCDTFDSQSIRDIVWLTRLDHYENLVNLHLKRNELKSRTDGQDYRYTSELLIAVELLCDLGILYREPKNNGVGLTDSFASCLSSNLIEFSEGRKKWRGRKTQEELVGKSLFEYLAGMTNSPSLPGSLEKITIEYIIAAHGEGMVQSYRVFRRDGNV